MTECSASRPEVQAELTVLEPMVLRRQPLVSRNFGAVQVTARILSTDAPEIAP